MRGAPRWFVAALLFVFSASLTGELVAAAPALAQVLFEEGRALMASGHTDEACAKFAESNRLDPATGTLLNLAVCNESRGKTATAWEQFRAAESASQYDRRADRVRFAREHIAKLEPRLSRVTIIVSERQQVPELRVTLDGVALEHAAWNVATPIDPGEHVVLAQAPGRGERTWPLRVQPGPAAISVAIELEPAPIARQSREARVARDAAASRQSDAPGASTTEVMAMVSGGVGAAALIAGGVFGVQAFSTWEERNRLCPDDRCVTPAAQRAQRSSERAARNANVAVGVGFVSLVAAGILYFLPERDEAVASIASAPTLGAHALLSASEIGASIEGSW